MTESTVKSSRRKSSREERSSIASAPRQPVASDAWKHFAGDLLAALRALDEDEYLNLTVKGTSRYVQFMCQGAYGMRVESVSDYYLPEDEHLGEADYHQLLRLGWHAPTALPARAGRDVDGSPNYFLDLAQPVPLEDVAVLAVLTLEFVHRAGHPGNLEYQAQSVVGQSIRFPHLPIRRREAKAPA